MSYAWGQIFLLTGAKFGRILHPYVHLGKPCINCTCPDRLVYQVAHWHLILSVDIVKNKGVIGLGNGAG